jgi:hypothetical protein
MSKPNLRAVPVTTTVSSAVEDAYSALEELQSECQELVDNATEATSQTQRIQTMDETANSLSAADSPPDVPEFLADLEVTYTEDRRKSKSTSRATRCAEACTVLNAVVDAIEEWISDQTEEGNDSQEAEAQELRDAIQEMIDAAEGCEFPGMYG